MFGSTGRRGIRQQTHSILKLGAECSVYLRKNFQNDSISDVKTAVMPDADDRNPD
jgi:hypothetical protein